MTIFLTILKIIGVILLSLLCLAVGLVLLLLFVPIRYEAEITSAQKVSVKAKITWLLRFIRLYLNYRDGLSMKLWVLFFSVPFKKEKKEDVTESIEENQNPGNTKSSDRKESTEHVKTETSEEAESTEHIETSESTQDHLESTTKTENVKPKKENWIPRIKRIFASILDKIKHIGKTIESTKTFLEDSHNKAAFSHIKDEVFLLLKHICPKKLKVDMSYSTGSPDTTAEVFGILAMFPIGYQNRWKIYPDFEADSFYARGTIDIKGKIYIYQILFAALRLVLDKNCRRLLKKIMN